MCFCGGGEGCSAQSTLATLQTAAAVWQGLSEIPLSTKREKKEVEAENGNVHKTSQMQAKMLVHYISFNSKTIYVCMNIDLRKKYAEP